MTNKLTRFLLVEDNDDHATLVRESLDDMRVCNTVDHVTDGSEALDYLHARGAHVGRTLPDVVLLDLNLPKVDGLGVLKEIKATAELRHIPVVVLTTSEAERDRASAYEYHANSYLVKPVDFDRFQTIVDEIGLYWGLLNARPN